MKKIIAPVAFACYLAVTSGVIVNFHYCMNRLASMQWFVTENKTCPTCGMHINKAHGCCHDEVKVVKMEVDQKSTPNFVFDLALPEITFQPLSEFIITPFVNFNESRHHQNHSPPLLTEQYTYLENRVFRV